MPRKTAALLFVVMLFIVFSLPVPVAAGTAIGITSGEVTVSVRASGGASCTIYTGDWPYNSQGNYYYRYVAWAERGDYTYVEASVRTHLDAPGAADDAHAYLLVWDWSGTSKPGAERHTGGSPPDQTILAPLFDFGNPVRGPNFLKFVVRGVGTDWWGSQTTCDKSWEFRVYYGLAVLPYFITNSIIVYPFDTGNENFAREVDRPYSQVKRALNPYVEVYSDRQDAEDELFTHRLGGFEFTPSGPYLWVMARWLAVSQGDGQGAFPIFMASGSSVQADAPGSLYVYYFSQDPDLGQRPLYYLRYKDASGALRINVAYLGLVNTEYCFWFEYNPSTRVVGMSIRAPSPNSCNTPTVFASGSYTLGTNPNDGFLLQKIGVASDGMSGTPSMPLDVARTDDISLYWDCASVCQV